MLIRTTATEKILALRKRIRGVAGGSSASKTMSIMIWLVQRAGSKNFGDVQENEIISVVSETMPHLKKGAIRDFLQIMNETNAFEDARWNKTDFIYTFPSGSIIEFFSADQSGKVKGPRRDILFINECNHIDYETYTQLEIRTKKIIWLDWNPESEFWWYTDVLHQQDVDFITLTYKDNEALDPRIVQALEARKSNVNWFKVYGLGELGDVESRIYTGWEFIDNVPPEARLLRYGLDFGYSNDPTASDTIFHYQGGYVLDEVLHQLAMSNRQIADTYISLPPAPVIADSAEPKSIDEIRSYGINILPSEKGRDSVNQGIQFVQGQKIYITKRSVNTIHEYRNYLWLTDKNGKIVNEPSPFYNHHMDDIRYAITSTANKRQWKPNEPGGVKPYIPSLLV